MEHPLKDAQILSGSERKKEHPPKLEPVFLLLFECDCLNFWSRRNPRVRQGGPRSEAMVGFDELGRPLARRPEESAKDTDLRAAEGAPEYGENPAPWTIDGWLKVGFLRGPDLRCVGIKQDRLRAC